VKSALAAGVVTLGQIISNSKGNRSMKRSLLFGGIGVAVLAVTIPAGAVIQNQVSRPRIEAKADAEVVVDLPTTTTEPTTTRSEPTEPPKTEPVRPPTTEEAPKPTRPPEPKPANFELRLECGTRSVENAVMNVCHWGEPNVDGVKGYKVWRAIGDNGREIIGRTEGHEWSERNAKAGARYSYAVEAVGDGGVSLGYSNTVVVALPAPPPPLALKLTCVSKVIETKLGVVCEWSAVERDGVRAYQLWRKVGDGARELVTTVPADGKRRFFDINVLRGQNIVYTVVAVDGAGAAIVSSDAVRVSIPIETPVTTVKPVETTTRPAGSEPTTTAGE
jgi:hypothetical protein